MKAWIIYGGRGDWLTASLVFENGWTPFGHCCSHPAYMPGDLILNRPERIAALAEMGIEVELQGAPIAGSNNPLIPPGLVEKYNDPSNYAEMQRTYNEIAARLSLKCLLPIPEAMPDEVGQQ